MPSTPAAVATSTSAFESGLRDLGYVLGNNLVLEYRYSGGPEERIGELTEQLVRAKVELIFTTTDSVVRTVARHAGSTPIVMVNVSDPVGNGLVKSLSRPGGSITGLTNLSPEIGGKRVQLLKECVPAVSRLAYLWDPRVTSADYRDIEAAARRLRLEWQPVEARSTEEIERGLSAVVSRGDTALIVQAPSPLFYTERARICRIAGEKRLPSMFHRVEYVAAGGLMSYGPSVPDMYRRAALYVDKILNGARPADLPVEQPSKFELAVNLRTAKALRLDIPQGVLAQADRIVQ